jgi:hypothetical protein
MVLDEVDPPDTRSRRRLLGLAMVAVGAGARSSVDHSARVASVETPTGPAHS